MSAESLALLPLAESIADGTAIDWDAAEAQAGQDDQAVVRQLRVLADLAGLHRSLPAEAVALPAPRPSAQPAIGNWAHLSLVERIGGGSSGDVYRAYDRSLEREVALKLLKRDDSQGDPDQSLVAREGRLLARVRHSNVATVHGVAVHDQRVGLWMELLRGVTLEEQLQTHGPLSAREAALVGIDLCRALAAIHAAGLIHRDVKAQNVMREDGGRIVLMDMGAGRELAPDARTTVSDRTGTPLYIAPELLHGGTASARTDIYSVGVLLYRLVTNSFPVRGATVDALLDAHDMGRRTRLRDARPDLPTAFVHVVERATAASPGDRYASAGELEAALVDTLDARAPGQRPAPRTATAGVSWPIVGVIAAALVVSFALWTAFGRGPAAPGAPLSIRSLAVLPLANLSGDPAQEYFADGMTEQLIATLGQLEGVQVISRTSVMRYKSTDSTLPDIARALGVDAVLEGSVMVMPGTSAVGRDTRVRINARLVRTATDTALWNRTFERVGDIFSLQDEVARAVTDGIDVRLASAGLPAIGRAQDFNVFDLYLRGRYFWNMRTREGFTQAIQYFQQALDRDPSYAPAQAGLADAYLLMAVYGFTPRDEAFARARTAAQAALKMDGSLGEAYASLGQVQASQLEGGAADASFLRAVQLSPSHATAHHWYADFLAQRERYDEALMHIATARSLDPLSVGVSAESGAILVFARRYDEAVARLQGTLQMDQSFARTHMVLSQALAGQGQWDRAVAEAERAASLAGNTAEFRAHLACMLAGAGRTAEAAAMVRALVDQFGRGEHAEPVAIAVVYATLRDNDGALEWLARAEATRDPWLGYLRVDPRFDNLRTDPRFDGVLARAGLAP